MRRRNPEIDAGTLVGMVLVTAVVAAAVARSEAEHKAANTETLTPLSPEEFNKATNQAPPLFQPAPQPAPAPASQATAAPDVAAYNYSNRGSSTNTQPVRASSNALIDPAFTKGINVNVATQPVPFSSGVQPLNNAPILAANGVRPIDNAPIYSSSLGPSGTSNQVSFTFHGVHRNGDFGSRFTYRRRN